MDSSHPLFNFMPGPQGGTNVNTASTTALQQGERMLQEGRFEEAAKKITEAIAADPDNLDAMVMLANILGEDYSACMEVLTEAERRGRELMKRIYGNDCFDDGSANCGSFWGLIESRPYMRVRVALTEMACRFHKYNLACSTAIESLRLCTSDNLGVRESLPAYLCHAKRYLECLRYCIYYLTTDHDSRSREPGSAYKLIPENQVDPAMRKPAAVEHKKKILQLTYFGAPQAYSAAVASFRLYGDCELARVMLQTGARLNKHVLIKILAKAPIPTDYNHLPAEIDSPEMAQDYLHIAQSQWEAPDIWAWANADKEAKSRTLNTCARPGCGKTETRVADYKRCSACKSVVYCSAACQAQHWTLAPDDHKTACKRIRQRQVVMN